MMYYFFFKQKTAYEMRISDWSSDVCSSDLIGETTTNAGLAFVTGGAGIAISVGGTSRTLRLALRDKTAAQLEKEGRQLLASMGVPGGKIGRASCRARVCQYV